MNHHIEAIDLYLFSRESDLLRLTRDLIATDSQIPPFSDEREIVALLSDRLSALGLTDQKVLAPSPERPSLLTRLSGTGEGRTLMLNGHVDTKPVGEAKDEWRTNPLDPVIIDDTLFGLGSNDMKAALAAMTYATAAVAQAGIGLGGDVLLAFVADEEAGATYGSRFIAPQLENIDAAIIGEPSGWQRDWQGIHLVSRGVCAFRIKVRGTQMHSSLSDRLPNVNASVKMAELMTHMQSEVSFDFTPHPLGQIGPTLNRGVMVSGGTYYGVNPGYAEFACDLRTVPGMTREAIIESVTQWLDMRKAQDPNLQVEADFDIPGVGWVPTSEIDAHHPLVDAICHAADDVLGERPPLSVFPGGTDAPWYTAYGIPTVPSFGPGMITSAHGPNEFVSLRSILEAARMYARIIIEFCR